MFGSTPPKSACSQLYDFRWLLVATFATLFCCVGCWEEIHYTADKQPQKESKAVTAEDPNEGKPASETEPTDPPAAERAESATDVSGEDLFGPESTFSTPNEGVSAGENGLPMHHENSEQPDASDNVDIMAEESASGEVDESIVTDVDEVETESAPAHAESSIADDDFWELFAPVSDTPEEEQNAARDELDTEPQIDAEADKETDPFNVTEGPTSEQSDQQPELDVFDDFRGDSPLEQETAPLSAEPTAPEADTSTQLQDEPTETLPEDSPAIADDPLEQTPVLEENVVRPSRTALANWQMSSKWSMAAALYAKSVPADRYEDLLQQAAYASRLVEVELPPLPEKVSAGHEAKVISFLLRDGQAKLADQLAKEFGEEHSALAEFAIRTQLLLLIYTPRSTELDPYIQEIQDAAERSELPQSLWKSLVQKLQQRASYAEVKQEVYRLHEDISAYLGGEEVD